MAQEKGYAPGAERTITCMIVVHVDDIIFSGVMSDYKDLQAAMKELIHGEWEALTLNQSITFCGISITLSVERTVEMTQEPYYKKIKPLLKSGLLEKGQMKLSARETQRQLKDFLWACLWLSQTRFDIGFSLSLLGTSIPSAILSPVALSTFIKLAGKLLDRIVQHHVPLRFVPFESRSDSRRFAQMFSFSDASYNSLPGGGSLEACLIIVGVPLRRDGIAQCLGNLFTWNSRRLTRVCRSSAQSEALALSNCGELFPYCQIVLTEVLTGEFQIHFLREVEACSILNPFKVAASPSEILEELRARHAKECPLSKDSTSSAYGLTALCRDCGIQSRLTWEKLVHSYLSVFGTQGKKTNRPSIHAIMLSDCANVISSLTGDPRCREKSSRLVCSHLQELGKFMAISYCSSPMNIADVGTEIRGNLYLSIEDSPAHASSQLESFHAPSVRFFGEMEMVPIRQSTSNGRRRICEKFY